MKRTELRDHIFRIVFEMEFNGAEEMSDQMALYFEQLEGASEKDLEYIGTKIKKISENLAEIDRILNDTANRWKTTRMNKVDLSILRLAVYEMRLSLLGLRSMRQWSLQRSIPVRTVLLL